MTTFPQILLRHQLAWLRSRYDHGAIPASIFTTIKAIETEISWHEHRAKHTNPRIRADVPQTAQRERR